MILATQSSADLTRNEMLQVIAESCGTLIFLANPRMDKGQYKELFHLNDKEAELIASLTPKKQMLIKRPDLSKVVQLNVASEGLLDLHEFAVRQRPKATRVRATRICPRTGIPCRPAARGWHRNCRSRLDPHLGKESAPRNSRFGKEIMTKTSHSFSSLLSSAVVHCWLPM